MRVLYFNIIKIELFCVRDKSYIKHFLEKACITDVFICNINIHLKEVSHTTVLV